MAATAHVLFHIRQWLSRTHPDPDSDATLVRRFVRDGDESAFASLVDRHGPMVLGVARRVVGDYHRAEDVFQATFLALARQAGSLRRPTALLAWLHQTAYHIAVSVLQSQRRRDRVDAESAASSRASCTPLDDLSSRELLAILDEELGRLPEKYRVPLLLCCLEGRSQEEAARMLGWTPGSVKGRLERGRQRLKEQLARRGITFAVGAGVPLLAVPHTLAGHLREAALRAARDGALASPAVAALAHGVAPALGKTSVIVTAAALIGIGVGLASLSAWTQPPQGTEAGPPMAAVPDTPAAPRQELLGEPLPEGAVQRLGSSRLRIGESTCVLTPDGRTIIAVSPEGIVREFDAQSGRFLSRRQLTERNDLPSHAECQVRLSADGKTAAFHEMSVAVHRVTVWDVPAGKQIFHRTASKEKYFFGYGLSPDGKQLALAELSGARGQETRTLQVIDLPTGREIALGNLDQGFVRAIRFTIDGKRVVVSQAGERNIAPSFLCFDLRDQKQLWRLPRKGKEWWLRGEEWAISPNGQALVSAVMTDEPGFQIIETDPETGQATERFKPSKEAARGVGEVMIAPDNRTVVIYRFNRVVLWDLRTGDEVRRFPVKLHGIMARSGQETLSSDGRTLLSNRGYLQRWDLGSGKPFFEAPPEDGLLGPVFHLAFTANSKEVVGAGDGLVARWDLATGNRVSIEYGDGRRLVATSGGLRLVDTHMTDRRDRIHVTDPITGKVLHDVLWDEPPELQVKDPRAFTLTRDGKTLVVAHLGRQGRDQSTYVTACDVVSSRRLSRFAVPGDSLDRCCPISPCGRWVVLNGKLYQVATGTETLLTTGVSGEQLLPGKRGMTPLPIWFSPDGRLLAGLLARKGDEKPAPTDSLAVWELASGQVLARIPEAGFAGQVAFAPDGRTLALFDAQRVRVYDLLTGKQLASYSAPDIAYDRYAFSLGPQSLGFAPDGRTLATGHEDGSVLLWQVPRTAGVEAERATPWDDLASDSPVKARAAVDRLGRNPGTALALLKTRFQPPPPPMDSVPALLKDLDSDDFVTRERADRRLRAQGARAEPDLRRALVGASSVDLKRRIEDLLDALTRVVWRLPLSGETLRGVRAIEVLERVGTPDARALLGGWAEQTQDQRLAAEARFALERSVLAKP